MYLRAVSHTTHHILCSVTSTVFKNIEEKVVHLSLSHTRTHTCAIEFHGGCKVQSAMCTSNKGHTIRYVVIVELGVCWMLLHDAAC